MHLVVKTSHTELMMKMISAESEIARKHISRLFDNLITYYQNTKERRKHLAVNSIKSEGFTVVEEVELLTVDIRGYASQIKTSAYVNKPEEAVNRLQNLRVFDVPCIAEWYFESSQEYLQMKFYIEMLDYLCLLVLEYIEVWQLGNEKQKPTYIDKIG